MKYLLCIPLICAVSGCATHKNVNPENYPAVAGTSVPQSTLSRVRTSEVVKSYPTGRYTDPDFPDDMHERHTLYRKEQSADWNYRPGGPYAYPLVVSDPTPSYYVKTDGDQRNSQQKAFAAALEEQNTAMKKRIESLQKDSDKVPILENQVKDLKEQLDAEPLASPAPKKQDPSEEKPTGFSEAEDPQGDLIAEMKLNDELNGELDALEGRRRLVLMDAAFLNILTP
ncbi:MAG: hypothetical protein ORN23_08400 [Chthoniobacterales bacterium]|nr:hypothetical protein [Chthoniobacterales bacterium]